jgi:hypothetical protein
MEDKKKNELDPNIKRFSLRLHRKLDDELNKLNALNGISKNTIITLFILEGIKKVKNGEMTLG